VEIRAPISIGELIDKITILEIKEVHINEPQKLSNIRNEMALLNSMADALPQTANLTKLREGLKEVNQILWAIEDALRDFERAKDFGPLFVEKARLVYKTNDKRAGLKNKINELLGSFIIEEKSYKSYE